MIGQVSLFILSVGIQGIIYAQVTPEKIDQRLQKIEQEVYQNPVAIKSELLGYLKQKSAIPDSTLGEIHLYLCITLGMTNQLDSGIWAAQESMRLLPDQSMLKASTLKTMAILYRLKGDWKMAEESIRQSIQLNDSLWKNPFLKTITLQEYASLCLDQSQFFKATTLFLEALKTIQTANQSDPKTVYTAVKLRTNLAEAYGKSKNYPFAIREFRSALAQMDSLKDKDGYVRAGINLAQTYIESKQPQQADSMLQLLMPQAELLQNEELKGYILLYKGDVLAYRKNFSKAISHYRSAFGLLEQNDSRMLPECAIGLLKALKATGGE
ncbi:MAG: tetratricopeptide repeat protein, partial [Bacteroidota bacterium]